MSDFLMRMVSRAAGVSPTVAPRLAFRIATREQDSALPPSSFESRFAGNNVYSDTISPRASSTPFEMDDFRRSDVESSVERSRETPQHLPHSTHFASVRGDASFYDSRTEDVAASELSRMPGDEILQSILVPNRMNVQPENESLNFTARKHTLSDPGKLPITDPLQERIESPAYQSRAESMEENSTNDMAARGRVRNTTRTTNSRQRTPSPESDPVEVKIGRVEVIMENPAPPLPTRPSPSRGFDDYAALRRYSPQAWNRWTRSR